MTYSQQVAEIVQNISCVLLPAYDAESYARALLEEADEDETHFEVRGLHTRSGQPHTFRIG